MSQKQDLPPGYTWYDDRQPVFHEGGGGCMGTSPPFYSVSVFAPESEHRPRTVIQGNGGSGEEARAKAVAAAWTDYEDRSKAPRDRLRFLAAKARKDGTVYSSDMVEILGLIADLLTTGGTT